MKLTFKMWWRLLPLNSYPKRILPPKRNTLHQLFYFCHICDISKEVMENGIKSSDFAFMHPCQLFFLLLTSFLQGSVASLSPHFLHITWLVPLNLLFMYFCLLCCSFASSFRSLILLYVLAAVFRHCLASIIFSIHSCSALFTTILSYFLYLLASSSSP